MAESIEVSIGRIRSMDMGCLSGKMENALRESGSLGSFRAKRN
jgi:hypothetical protein